MLVEIIDSESDFKAIIKQARMTETLLSERTVGSLIMAAVYAFYVGFGCISLVGIVSGEFKPDGEGPFMEAILMIGGVIVSLGFLVFGAIWLFQLVRLWVWYLFGTDTLYIDDNELILKRHILLASSTFSFAKNQIFSISYSEGNSDWFRKIMRLHAPNPIYFGHFQLSTQVSSHVRFGGMLNKDDCITLATKLSEFWEVRGFDFPEV